MFKLITLVAYLALASLLHSAAGQKLESCRVVCTKEQGNCKANLIQLARTPCFDDVRKKERTCDCGFTSLLQVAALGQNDVIQDCVIPLTIFHINSGLEIKAKMLRVHAQKFLGHGNFDQKGDIISSTICEWQCASPFSNRYCIMSGNVLFSTFKQIRSESQAGLALTGDRIAFNDIDTISGRSSLHILSKHGFDHNKVKLITSGGFGILTPAAAKLRNNHFDVMSFPKVTSFGTFDGNTADSVAVGKSQGLHCNISNPGSKIKVSGFLGLPDNDPECRELFTKV